MNLPTDHAPHVAAAVPSRTTRRTRRPSGEPPALPRHLQISGVGWLAAAALLVGAALLVFAGGLRRRRRGGVRRRFRGGRVAAGGARDRIGGRPPDLVLARFRGPS